MSDTTRIRVPVPFWHRQLPVARGAATLRELPQTRLQVRFSFFGNTS